uniref:Uncharacterized protein n=1 Tax=Arundo donax TaxID=35708 RepID=A0A0A8YXH2_ARUDO
MFHKFPFERHVSCPLPRIHGQHHQFQSNYTLAF